MGGITILKARLDAMTTEQLDLATVDRVLSRLERQTSDTRVSCVERLLFFGLTASIYAIPLLTAALLVGRTFNSVIYGALVGYLQSLLVYAIVAAAVFVPLNARLFAKTVAHQRRIRRHEDLRLADYLFGRRGRLEESADARTLLRHGMPALLTGVLIVSLAAGVWSVEGPGVVISIVALLACIAFFFVQQRCQQLFDFLRRRIDYSRELLTVRRQLEQRRRRAVDLGTPITLSRIMALRLSDLDRMYVLTSEAAARVRAERPGITGAAVTWTPNALEESSHLTPDDRPVLVSAIQYLSVELARHRRRRRPEQGLPSGLRSALADAGLQVQRDGDGLSLDVPIGHSRRAAVSIAAGGALEELVVTSVMAEAEPADGAQ
jgi:hypothetical protein